MEERDFRKKLGKRIIEFGVHMSEKDGRIWILGHANEAQK
jgi:hypothetical protein